MNRQAHTFSEFHPVVSLLYFVAILGFSMFIMHPIALVISFSCAGIYAIYLNGKAAITSLKYMIPLLLLTAILNPLFNHRGVTILAYLPNGNPLTLESITYGIAAAIMLITVITWFTCLNKIITGEKLVYLFGRVSPALALILAMSLRFVPRFIAQMRVISHAQKCIGQKRGIKTISILLTWALENAIETADSMKARGYGLPNRTAFSVFRFRKRDGYAIAYISTCIICITWSAVTGALYFRYFPTIGGNESSTPLAFIAYLALGILPIAVNFKT
ncbi:MAG: energy-coupling factor transporter transmembrane protein EcfT [Defluviitaleaceae bacterium]|nr:energy-coupling factor transporter transmembrane protein EcfT [Defluviitaleaceae bacterium]